MDPSLLDQLLAVLFLAFDFLLVLLGAFAFDRWVFTPLIRWWGILPRYEPPSFTVFAVSFYVVGYATGARAGVMENLFALVLVTITGLLFLALLRRRRVRTPST